MSQGHADTVRAACQAWSDGDISVYREMYAPDVVADGGGLWPEGEGSIKGAEAVIGNFESILAAFQRSELVPLRFYEQGDGLVAELLWRGVLPGSEAPIEQRIACAYRFRDGLIAYTAWHPDVPSALADVGVAEGVEGVAGI
jgi:ketosteroid isomerase-like protein